MMMRKTGVVVNIYRHDHLRRQVRNESIKRSELVFKIIVDIVLIQSIIGNDLKTGSVFPMVYTYVQGTLLT